MNKRIRQFARISTFLITTCLLSACDYSDNPDHKLPAGQGSIYVDNQTTSDIRVYIDGVEVKSVDSYDHRAYDLDPGVYRVVLDEDGGDRTFRDDIDVVEGRLTVLDTSTDPFSDINYDVEVFFRTPD